MFRKTIQPTIITLLVFALVACGSGTGTTIGPNSKPPVLPANTPVQGELVISNTNAFVDTYGTYRVVGMLMNKSNNVYTAIELTIEIQDSSGNSLLTENGSSIPSTIFHPMLQTLAPGEGSPFEYSLNTASGTPASYKVSITGQQAGTVNRANLTAENVQLVDNGSGWFYLAGEVVNKGNQWAHISSLSGAVLDASNNVLSADWTATFATELAPAGDLNGLDRSPFVISFPNPGNNSNPPWSLYWDTNTIDQPTTYSLYATITNSYTDQYGAQHLIGWVINQSNDQLTGKVIAGLYDQNGLALDASYSQLPVPVKPGGSMPFSVSIFSNVDGNSKEAALVRTYTAQVDPGDVSSSNEELISLDPSGVTTQKDGSDWTISGTINNSSKKSLASITLFVSILDAQKNLAAMEYTTIFPSGSTIAPGENNPYSVTISIDPNIDSSGFTVSATAIGDAGQ